MFNFKIIKPKFWDKSGFNLFSFFLIPFTLVTQIINYLKKFKKKQKFKAKSVCVGNIYLGGTGKTQLVIKLNQILKKKYKIYVIKKYYENQKDEQDLLKNSTNLILSQNRSLGMKKIKNQKKNLAIFDDGLQDKSIKYDLSIVCFTSIKGFGNGKVLPAGPLRENLSEIKNYNAIFINGNRNLKLEKKIKSIKKNINIFYGKYFLKNRNNFDKKLNYLAFCGLGTPENFFNLLKENKIHIKKKIIFPDHFNYKISDIKKIKQYANENNLKVITSEKDYTKIKHFKNMNIKFTKVDLYINRNLIFEKFLLNNL